MGSNGFFRISLRFHHVPPGAVITTICDLCTVLLMSAAMLLDTSRTPVLSTLSNHARDCVIIFIWSQFGIPGSPPKSSLGCLIQLRGPGSSGSPHGCHWQVQQFGASIWCPLWDTSSNIPNNIIYIYIYNIYIYIHAQKLWDTSRIG